MCGINGFNFKSSSLIKAMNKGIKHRGPDDTGEYVNNKFSFGQTRLSIIDLSAGGHQPMFYSKKLGSCSERFNKKNISKSDVSITYNGEIYNYKEIKEELLKKGYKFASESDTEVMLGAYLEWGFKCVDKFNGMWAFVIHDKKKNILFCSRDRLGVKPFYYYNKNERFIFSSELKGITQHRTLKINSKKNINFDAFNLYFALGYIPAPYTIYNDVFKLQASHNLIFNLKTNKIDKIWRYYDIPKYSPINNKKKLIAQGRKILEDATRVRMRSDVPVGAFLSGGLDSSTTVGLMKNFTDLKNLHTFSIGFEGKFDETPYINIVKDYFNTNHHHYYFKKKHFEEIIGNHSQIFDEPFGDHSALPTYMVSKHAKKYVSVSLSGDGGDEIFGGYMNHVTGSRMDLLRKVPKPFRYLASLVPAKKNLNSFTSFYLLKEAMKVSLAKPEDFYGVALRKEGIKPKIYRDWSKEKLKYCLAKGGGKMGEAMRTHDLLFNSLADNFLAKVDRASMANALEVRSPFLDYRLVEFAQKIPTKWKQDVFRTKKLMREIIKDIIPEEIVNRGKQGFTPPLKFWIVRKEYEPKFKEYLEFLKGIDLEMYNFFKNKVFKEDNEVYINYKIRLFLFGLWYEKWIK